MGNTSSSCCGGGAAGSCSTSTVVTETATGSHILRINSYANTRGQGVGKSINSGTFMAGGHSWYIAYFPDGEREECADWISLYLYLDCPADKHDVVKARFTFTLLDRRGRKISGKKTGAGLNFSLVDGTPRWGYRKFVRQEDLERFSHLDCFQIRCDVTVIKVRVETTTAQV